MKLISKIGLALRLGAVGLCLTRPTFADARITVQALDDGGYRLRLTSPDPMTIEEARRRVLPMGEQLCGSVEPTLGASELKAAGQAGGNTTFLQEIHCSDTASKTDAGKDPASGLSQEQRQHIQERAEVLSRTYLEDLAGDRYEAAYSVLAAVLQGQRPFRRWQQDFAAWRRTSGPLQSRVFRSTSVFVDPPNSRPGTYAIVKFEESFQQLPIVCGFLVWAFDDNGDARIIRDVQAHLTTKVFSRLERAQRRGFRRAKGCDPA